VTTDSFSPYDDALAKADYSASPWESVDGQLTYVPDWDLLQALLAIPVRSGQAQTQQSGAAAKALDSWIAHELRRGGFPPDAVWPRSRRPRVLPPDLADLERAVEELVGLVDAEEKRIGKRMQPAAIRSAIKRLPKSLPGKGDAYILGRFYAKQVDVAVSAWQRGPDVLVSSKTQFSSYAKNKNNRYEEALGEAPNLRDRYPLAAMGFAFLVRNNIYAEAGAFELLRDLLLRLRKPHGPFDATMLLVGEWADDDLELGTIDEPAKGLTAAQFFADLLNTVTLNTPVDVHTDVRLRKDLDPKGGVPDGPEDLGEGLPA
jgi:hypothetical protein